MADTSPPDKLRVMADQNALKRAVAAKALDYVRGWHEIGVWGPGTTAEIFVGMLWAPQSSQPARSCFACRPRNGPPTLARKLGFDAFHLWTIWRRWTSPSTVPMAPTRNLDLIKGGGGMLLREKIVASILEEDCW